MNHEPSKINSSPDSRARGGMILFGAFGILGIIIARQNFVNAWPVIIFYGLLLWNDYSSIKHFSSIVPPNKTSQMLIDGALVVFHFLLVFSFNDPRNFYLVTTMLFILATLKYSYDLPLIHNSPRLYRKIKIDTLGAMASAIATTGILFGYTWTATLTWMFIFGGATVYVMYINPLYKDTLGAS
jgi:hypothetical protein